MVTLDHISKEYKGVKILKNISLTFRKNELVCILGPSGSGKTTLLNLIGALDAPTKGNIYLGSQNINSINHEFYHNSIVSFIFQNYNLLPNLNIYDNLVLPLRLTSKPIDHAKINIFLKKFVINKTLEKSINNLSGGEKQRVAIIRSMLQNSKMILADEPTGALDTLNSKKVMGFLKEVSKEKLVIIVTHNEELADKYASRIIKIKDGKIVFDSKPCLEKYNYNYEEIKTKLKIKERLKISLTNLKAKKIKNILTILAFSIGLFSLSLVLSISNGFSKEIKALENNSLYNYPLIISKETIIQNTSLNDNSEYNNTQININKQNQIIKNRFDEQLYNKLNTIKNKNLAFLAYYKDIDKSFKNISHVNPSNEYFNLIKGKIPDKLNEVLLLIDYNNSINELVYEYLNISNLDYESILNKTLIVDGQALTITGIVKSNNEYFSSLNGILYSSELFNNEITDVYIYSTNYKNKEQIKEILKDYNIIDNAKEVISITSSLIKGITTVLIIFCIISIIVSSIMIGVMSYISIIERKNEIGIMESLGAKKKDIKKLFLTENNIISLISSFISIIFTFLVSKVFNQTIYSLIGFKALVSLNFQIIISIFMLSLSLIYICNLFSTRILKKKTILDNLKNT